MHRRWLVLAATGLLTACSLHTENRSSKEAGGARPSGQPLVETDAPPAPKAGRVTAVEATLDDLIPTEPKKGSGKDAEGIESDLTEDEILALEAIAKRLPPSERIDVLEKDDHGPLAPTTVQGFDAIDASQCCAGATLNPPDPEMAAGPGHLIAVVNSSIRIFDTSGTSLFGPTNLETFFSPVGAGCTIFAFDPNALYDERENRYIVAADGNGSHYCVAVSQTGNPLGAWNFYAFPVNVGGAFFDFPHAGVGRDAIYLGGNMFNPGFTEARVWAFDKAAMYAGSATAFVSHGIGTNATPQPINLHGAAVGTWPNAGPHHIVTSRGGFSNPTQFGLWSWDDPFGLDLLVDLTTLDLGAVHGVPVGFPVDAQQSGGGNIQTNDNRPLDFEYRNGSGYFTNQVSCNPGAGTVNCIQWAEVDLAGTTVVQAGVFSSNGDYRYYPDLAVNHCGDVAVGYSRSNATSFPGVWMTGRETDDPLGTMQAEVMLRNGDTTMNSPSRWGDYTGMTISPDGLTFYYLGEYAKNLGGVNWGTWIGAGKFFGCPAPYWTHVTGNGGSGQMYWWFIGNDDRYVSGDFDGDGDDDLLAINPVNGWHHTMSWTGSGWQWIEGNGSGQIGLWFTNPTDHYVAGDFDGDGKDELLAINPANGWHHTIRYTGGAWQWISGGGTGQIGLWFINTPDHYLTGDFDGDGKDELLALNPSNGWHHTMSFMGTTWQWLGGGGTGQIALWFLDPDDWYQTGDYDGDGKDELLALNPNGWHHTMRLSGTAWQWFQGGGSGQIGLWFVNAPDRYVSGDFDGDGAANLLSINPSNGWSHTSRFAAGANVWQWMAGNAGAGQMAYWIFGAQDRHIPGDYDGDGKVEVLQVNPNGWWHVDQYP